MKATRVRCTQCSTLKTRSPEHIYNSLEIQLGGRIIAYLKNVCPDCVAELVVLQGFKAVNPGGLDADNLVLDLPIAGMRQLDLIRVGSRSKWETN